MGNTFGRLFRITTWGESHGPAIGVVIDGCPSQIAITATDFQKELNRRRPGQSSITSPRTESDTVEILSGIFENQTLGTPISLLFKNTDVRSDDYDHLKNVFRPGHADFTYQAKYGIRDHRGGGRSSARETLARVAAAVIARKILPEVQFRAFVSSVGTIDMPTLETFPTIEEIESNAIRCPHPETAARMIQAIEAARDAGDSLGGIITCRIRNTPIGLGNPVFDRLEADLAKAMLSIPATKGFEIGSGFAGTRMPGSEHNDALYLRNGKVITEKNCAGGTLGGISNGEEIVFRVAFKPTSTIQKPQQTVNRNGEEISLTHAGRHDPCVLPRAVPIIEAMAALVLADHFLLNQALTLSKTETAYVS